MSGFVSVWICPRSYCLNISCCIEFDVWNMRVCIWFALSVVYMAIRMTFVRRLQQLLTWRGNRFIRTLYFSRRSWLKRDLRFLKNMVPGCSRNQGRKGTRGYLTNPPVERCRLPSNMRLLPRSLLWHRRALASLCWQTSLRIRIRFLQGLLLGKEPLLLPWLIPIWASRMLLRNLRLRRTLARPP
ncbi:hypothetical protein LINPERHAP2_LOCUS3164 [Linum perenne]